MRRNSGRRFATGITVGAMLLTCTLAACSDDTTTLPQNSWTPPPGESRTPEQVDPTTSPSPTQSERNDLARLPLKRVINAGPLTVNVEYGTRLDVRQWRGGVSKPLQISLTAVNKKKRGQKIYLSRATATVTAFDDRGQVGDSRNVTDTANINPGYIVTFPNDYNQTLSLPSVDSSALSMTIDLTYEFVLEVDKSKEGRDFAKQVATDSITVPLAP